MAEDDSLSSTLVAALALYRLHLEETDQLQAAELVREGIVEIERLQASVDGLKAELDLCRDTDETSRCRIHGTVFDNPSMGCPRCAAENTTAGEPK